MKLLLPKNISNFYVNLYIKLASPRGLYNNRKFIHIFHIENVQDVERLKICRHEKKTI